MLPDKQFRLITLGRLALEAPEGAAEAAELGKQRRKLAVLAVLAVSRQPVARDALGEMFWGDRPEARARHSLTEALSHLRRVLGPGSVTARGAEVSLSPGAPLVVDAREFAAALEDGRSRAALALYRGPFLHGCYVEGSPTFDAWADRERRRLEGLFERGCEVVCAADLRAGRWQDAAQMAGRWLEADPVSEAAALALMDALAADGSEEGAARALKEFERLRIRMERELGRAPAARLRARAAELARRGEEGATSVAASPPVSSSGPPTSSGPVSSSSPPGSSGAPSVPRAGPGARVPRRYWLQASLALVAVAVVVMAVLLIRGGSRAEPASPTTVAVLPFTVGGPAEYGYLKEGVVDLLSADLDGAGPMRSVDPRAILAAGRAGALAGPDIARQLGAGLYVLGNVVVSGGRLRIAAELFNARGGSSPLARASVEGPPAELFALVDRLAREILSASSAPVPPMGRLAALTTASLPALKAYLAGETMFRRGQYIPAFEAFSAATQADSTFALAHYRLAQAGHWSVPATWTWDSIVERSRIALRHSHRLSAHPRLLVEGYNAWVSGKYAQAEAAYRTVVRTYPQDVQAWYDLGEVLFHTNPMHGRPVEEARAPFERVLTLEPDHLGAMTHLVRIRLRAGEGVGADSLLDRLIALSPPPRRAEFRTLRAFAWGTERDREDALTELRRAGDDEATRAIAHRVAVYVGDTDGARRVLELLLDPAFRPIARAHAFAWLAKLEAAHGRWRAANAQLAAAAALDPALALRVRAILATLPYAPAAPGELAAIQSDLAHWAAAATPNTTYPWLAVYNGMHPLVRAYLLGVVSLRRGQPAGALRMADSLRAAAAPDEAGEFARGMAESLRAQVAAARGSRAEALAGFDRGMLDVSEGLLESDLGMQALERWTRGELLMQLGRDRDALRWLTSLPEAQIDGLVYLAPVELREAEIYDRLGDRRRAAEHYARFAMLWRDCDPELAPLVARARQRLNALGK